MKYLHLASRELRSAIEMLEKFNTKQTNEILEKLKKCEDELDTIIINLE